MLIIMTKKNHVGDAVAHPLLDGVKGTGINDINAKIAAFYFNGIIRLFQNLTSSFGL